MHERVQALHADERRLTQQPLAASLRLRLALVDGRLVAHFPRVAVPAGDGCARATGERRSVIKRGRPQVVIKR